MGGGFFGANSAHPFENPPPVTNFVQVVLTLLIPAGLTYTFGVMVGDRRQGWTIFSACGLMFLVGTFVCYWAEQQGNPTLAKVGSRQALPIRSRALGFLGEPRVNVLTWNLELARKLPKLQN